MDNNLVQRLGPEAKLYVVGMTEDAVYVHDYATDSLYAFYPSNGEQKWVCPEKCMIFGGAHGILFTCDGDPVVNGPELYEKSLMRLDRNTGHVKWYNTNFVSVVLPPISASSETGCTSGSERSVFPPNSQQSISIPAQPFSTAKRSAVKRCRNCP